MDSDSRALGPGVVHVSHQPSDGVSVVQRPSLPFDWVRHYQGRPALGGAAVPGGLQTRLVADSCTPLHSFKREKV